MLLFFFFLSSSDKKRQVQLGPLFPGSQHACMLTHIRPVRLRYGLSPASLLCLPIQGSNSHLPLPLHCRLTLYRLPLGKPLHKTVFLKTLLAGAMRWILMAPKGLFPTLAFEPPVNKRGYLILQLLEVFQQLLLLWGL